MMAVIEAVLAVVGLVLLIVGAWLVVTEPLPEPPKTYVVECGGLFLEAVLAAVRIQQTAQELELVL